VKKPHYKIERNTAPHPSDHEWVIWLVDEYGDEWTMGFAFTRAEARAQARSKAMQSYLKEEYA
jgi:hypothetical protein